MQVVLYAYFFISGLFALYFNYVYAVTKGFWSWIMFGEIVATVQGLLWPLYLLNGTMIF